MIRSLFQNPPADLDADCSRNRDVYSLIPNLNSDSIDSKSPNKDPPYEKPTYRFLLNAALSQKHAIPIEKTSNRRIKNPSVWATPESISSLEFAKCSVLAVFTGRETLYIRERCFPVGDSHNRRFARRETGANADRSTMLVSYSRLTTLCATRGGGVKTLAPDSDKRRIGDSSPFSVLPRSRAASPPGVVTLHNALMAFHVADTF